MYIAELVTEKKVLQSLHQAFPVAVTFNYGLCKTILIYLFKAHKSIIK